jgi:hypothetical protein
MDASGQATADIRKPTGVFRHRGSFARGNFNCDLQEETKREGAGRRTSSVAETGWRRCSDKNPNTRGKGIQKTETIEDA